MLYASTDSYTHIVEWIPSKRDVSFDPLPMGNVSVENSSNVSGNYVAPDFLDYDQLYLASNVKGSQAPKDQSLN
jgi:hypothetical protein